MRNILSLTALGLVLGGLAVACHAPNTEKPDATQPPNLEIASDEYVALAEAAMQHKARFDFDAWGAMLADDVEYLFPDGDHNTRTKLVGKEAVLNWWKAWKANSGIQFVSISEANWLPVKVNKTTLKAGARPGVYVIVYFSNEMIFKTGTARVRMNHSIHFNDDKKMDRIAVYYDRVPIVKAMQGENYLEQSRTNSK